MSAPTFNYDVFLSYSSKDKAVIYPLAERLKSDGLRVWLDTWEIQPGDNIPERIEDGLDDSNVLVLCMSANAFGSDWAFLESQTFRFRDPLNKDRRFIPLRIDGAETKGSLGQFSYVDWRKADKEVEYLRLLNACRRRDPKRGQNRQQAEGVSKEASSLGRTYSIGHTDSIVSIAFSRDGKQALSGSHDHTVRLWDLDVSRVLRVFDGHTGGVQAMVLSPDAKRFVSCSEDNTARLWDIESGQALQIFKGHTGPVFSIAISADGNRLLSGSYDDTVRLWDLENGQQLRVFRGHSGSVFSVAFSRDGKQALSGSSDNTVRLWDLESGRHQVLKGHTGRVFCVAISADRRWAASGSEDNTMRLWNIESGKVLRIVRGHTAKILTVAFSEDGTRALSGGEDQTLRLWNVENGREQLVLKGHAGPVFNVVFGPDGRRALSGSYDDTMRLWDLENGQQLLCLAPRGERVVDATFSGDGKRVLSRGKSGTDCLWDLESGQTLPISDSHNRLAYRTSGRAVSADGMRTIFVSDVSTNKLRLEDNKSNRKIELESHTNTVLSVAISADGKRGLSGGRDSTVVLWDFEHSRALRVFEGHTEAVLVVALSADGRRALSGSEDKTVRLWDLETGRALVLEGHTNKVVSVHFSIDGRQALTGSHDNTVRLWDLETGRAIVLEGHTDSVVSVAFTEDGKEGFSAASNGVCRKWNLQAATELLLRSGIDSTLTVDDVQYTNAKVLLVGETGAGKTGLSKVLAGHCWEPSDSTVGAWATQWSLPISPDHGIEREIWLWDFGGQADQRLIHQLYMEDTAVAVLVFDAQKEDLFETLGQWDRDIVRASSKPFTKLLVAGRVDAGGIRVSRTQVNAFARERGFTRFLETSAKANIGCEELKQAVVSGIRWPELPWRSSPRLFKRLKDEILRIKEEGRVLVRFKELWDALRLRLTEPDEQFCEDELKAVVGLLAGPGVVWELAFGGWVLLQPERINAYAQAVIQTLREDELERGLIPESRVLCGELSYYSSAQRLETEDERFVLLAMHQTLIERGLCLREQTDSGPILIFPSYYRRERPDMAGHPAVLLTYQFNGFLDDIYATLVVRLHHTKSFKQDQLWRYAADFKTLTDKQLGVKLTRRSEGAGELEVYFDPEIPIQEKIIFARYVHEHVFQKGKDVVRLRHYVCQECGTPVADREQAMKRLGAWLAGNSAAIRGGSSQELDKKPIRSKSKIRFFGRSNTPEDSNSASEIPTIICVNCERRVLLWDDLEVCFAQPDIQQMVRRMQEQSATVLDNESKERALVGEMISTVALAGQISREFNVSDHGIDMEIEFKNDEGEATGKRLYLQLKSGDSYLRRRKSDGKEVFEIKKERHARYWMEQPFPVMLVVRTSDGEVRWMDVRDWLRQANNAGTEPVRQIVFEGVRCSAMSVRAWRDRVLSQS